MNLDTDTFSTRPTCLLLYLLLVCVAHAHLFSEVKKNKIKKTCLKSPAYNENVHLELIQSCSNDH